MPARRPCAQWFGAISRVCRCSAQLGGMSIRRETPRPRGRVPSTAAWTMSGARQKLHAGQSFADAFAGGDRLDALDLAGNHFVKPSPPLGDGEEEFPSRFGPDRPCPACRFARRLDDLALASEGLRRPRDRDHLGEAVRIFEEPDFDRPRAEGDFVDIGRNSLSGFWRVGVVFLDAAPRPMVGRAGAQFASPAAGRRWRCRGRFARQLPPRPAGSIPASSFRPWFRTQET